MGRSTTIWHLAAELALRRKRVRSEDLDQGAHLSRVFDAHPLGLDNLQLGGNAPADLLILDTAPEADQARALDLSPLFLKRERSANHGVCPPTAYGLPLTP